MRVPSKINRERVARARRQADGEVRRIDWKRAAANHDARRMVLAITAGLDDCGSIGEGMCIDERQRHAFRADFFDERGDVFCKPRAAPVCSQSYAVGNSL